MILRSEGDMEVKGENVLEDGITNAKVLGGSVPGPSKEQQGGERAVSKRPCNKR